MWRFTTTLTFVNYYFSYCKMRHTLSGWDSWTGGLGEGTSLWRHVLGALRKDWVGPPGAWNPRCLWKKAASSKPEGDLVRVVAEGVEVLLSFQEGFDGSAQRLWVRWGLWAFLVGFSHINNICSNTYAHQKINSEINPTQTSTKEFPLSLKQSLGT